MEFIKTNKEDLSKVIITIEKTNTGYTKKIYNSLLDMPPAERDAYIAQAFSDPNAYRPRPEETLTRIHLERMLNARLAKHR